MLLLLQCPFALAQAAERAPNIVCILVDDLGGADLGCYGSSFYETPNIDRLGAAGMRFTAAYAAAPVCSPSRASLLTGKHPARLRLTDWLPGRPDLPAQRLLRPVITRQLPLEEVTLAEALKSAGYVSASIGKWHLGGTGFLPENQGFDLNVAGDETGTPLSYLAPFQSGTRTMAGLETSRAGEYLTDRLTTEAERFIEANRERPFFLYLSHYAVHIPLTAKEEFISRYAARARNGPQTNAIYAAMIASVDESVGRVVDTLERLRLRERTVIIFTSDNGGLAVREGPNTPATSNAPLRAGKGHLYEGGIRVPLIVSWPGQVKAGAASDTPVSIIDLNPTLRAMAGLRSAGFLDGADLSPVLRQSGSLARERLYWHYPHYSNQGGQPGGAVREGDFKLIQFYENGRLQLFDLKNDPGETHDLTPVLPDKARALRQQLHAWRRDLEAQIMEPNPEYQPAAAAPQTVAGQMPDGRVFLHSSEAAVHGGTLRYEPPANKRTLGYWTKVDDWVSWDFEIFDPGLFDLLLLQGCGPGSGGSEVEVTLADQVFRFQVEETGGFQNFVDRRIGQVKLEKPGRYTLSVRPKSKPGLAVMDLRAVTLSPQRGERH